MNNKPQDAFLETQHRHAKRCAFEARIAGLVWLIAGVVCCSTMYHLGYVPPEARPDEPNLIFGFPSWVFYGLVIPWVVLVFVIWGFAAFILRDDEEYHDFPFQDEAGQ